MKLKNLNKNIFHIFILILLYSTANIFAQSTYGPEQTDYRRDLSKYQDDAVQSNGLGGLNTEYVIGHESGPWIKRAVYQWNIDDTEIPDGSEITYVKLTLTYTKLGHSFELPANFYRISYDMISEDFFDEIFDEMDYTVSPIGQQLGVNNTITFESSDPNHSFNLAVKNSLPGNKFVLGIKWDLDHSSFDRTWGINNFNLKLSVTFTPLNQQVTVDQKLSDDTRVGTLKMWDWDISQFGPPFSPPQTFPFPQNSQQVIQGDQSEYSGEKYNNWNYQSDVTNHHEFTITPLTNNLTSNFKPNNYSVIVQNNLESTGVTGGNIQFKDPWLIDFADPVYNNEMRNRGFDDAVFNTEVSPLDFSQPAFSNYKGVFLNQDYNDPNVPYYSVKADQTQDIYLSETGKTHKFYFRGWSGTDVAIESSTSLETGVVFTNGNAVVNANLKGTQLSDDAGAYLNNSQRKFVRTDNGYLHMVYESMGKAWYEISTDAGLTWQIANNGLPLSGSKDSKLPAIDYSGDVVVIVWQQEDIGAYDIIMAKFTAGNYMYGATIFMDIYLPYSSNTNPVVSWDGEGRILVMWKRDEDNYGYWPTGIVFSYGALSMLGWNEMDFDVIPTTNSNSINPTLVADKDYNLIPAEYHLAWEEPAGFYTYVKYFELYRDGYNEIQSRFPATPSDGAGFWTNRKPSIIVLDDHTPRLVWIGYTPWYGHRTVFRAKQTNGLWSSTIINYGSYSTESVNINRTYDNNYAFVFSESFTGYQNKYVKNSNLWTMNNLGTTGRDIQICNADNFYNMFCLAFQSNVTLPYRFVQSSSFGNLNKQNKKRESIGRAAIVTKDSTEFIYALGDVLLNDEPIKFKDVKDTIQINSQQELNNYLKSKPFYLDNRSALSFSVVSGVVNPRVAPMLLEDGKYVKFKVELIEDKTGEILNSFAILEYNANNVEELTNLSFSLKTSGMIKTKVHLKILLDENISGEYTLSELIGVDSVLHIGKEGYQEVSFGGDLAVIEYALEQNYPNPFNPSTTLKYQIPQNGFVTLKVYDILGKEVASLVNEVKTQGRYEATFNASDLASGVYLYRLNVNDYIDVKKMILLK